MESRRERRESIKSAGAVIELCSPGMLPWNVIMRSGMEVCELVCGMSLYLVDSDLWLHQATWEAYEWMCAMGDVLFKWLLFTSGLMLVLLAILAVLSDHGYCVTCLGLRAERLLFLSKLGIKSNTVSTSKSEASPDLRFLVMWAGSITSLTLSHYRRKMKTLEGWLMSLCEFLWVE